MQDLKIKLDSLYARFNENNAISRDKLDPLLKVYELQKDNSENLAYKALICAMFAYGNVKAILKFLDSLDFSLLDSNPKHILDSSFPLYRFQTRDDVKIFFYALKKLQDNKKLESILKNSECAKDAISGFINALYIEIENLDSSLLNSQGLKFLIGQKESNSPLKRWNMYLRWMVRKDNIDLGLFSDLFKKENLLLPLDTHTFKVSRNLGLLNRKSYDFKAVLEVTENLKKFDPFDPIKYDFALYRIGQNKEA